MKFYKMYFNIPKTLGNCHFFSSSLCGAVIKKEKCQQGAIESKVCVFSGVFRLSTYMKMWAFFLSLASF